MGDPKPKSEPKPANPETITFVQNVKRTMALLQVESTWLREQSGVSKSSLNYLLSYEDEHSRHPTSETMSKIAAALGLPLWLMLKPELTEAEIIANTTRKLNRNNNLQTFDHEAFKMVVTDVAAVIQEEGYAVDADTLFGIARMVYDRAAGARNKEALRPEIVRMVKLTVIQGGKDHDTNGRNSQANKRKRAPNKVRNVRA